jgi:hypothetical protein
MKECPSCGYASKKAGAEKPWNDFEFTQENFSAFRDILMKFLAFLRANELSKLDVKEIRSILAERKRGQRIPFDVVSKFEAVRTIFNISLYAILEYFHSKKVAPKNCIRIKDTSVYSAIEKIRHFSAHVIVDRNRGLKAIKGYEEKVHNSEREIIGELYVFILDGIDKYIDMKKLLVVDLKNTDQARELLRLVNQKRKKDNRQMID